jgi:hypothetical protein
MSNGIPISNNKDKILQLVREYVESKNIKYNTTIFDKSFNIEGLILPPGLQKKVVTKFNHRDNSDVTKHNIPIINTRVKLSAMTNYNVGLAAYGNQIITDYIGKNTKTGICSTSSKLLLELLVITYKERKYSVIQDSDYQEFIKKISIYGQQDAVNKTLIDNYGITHIIKHNMNNMEKMSELFNNCKDSLFFIIGGVRYLNLDYSTIVGHRSCIVINKETDEILISDSAMSLFPLSHYRNIEYYLGYTVRSK